MSTSTHSAPSAHVAWPLAGRSSGLAGQTRDLPTTYNDLIRLFPLRPIRTGKDFAKAQRVIDALAVLDRRTRDQEDFLDVLTGLFEAYENELTPINTVDLSPLDMLRHLIAESGMNASDLGRLLGHRRLGSAILRGERGLSKTHIRILAEHFHVGPELFLAAGKDNAASAASPARGRPMTALRKGFTV